MKASNLQHQQNRPNASTLRGVLRVCGLVVAALLWLLCAIPIAIASLFGSRARFRVVTALTAPFCRTMAFFIGLRIHTQGKRDPNVKIVVANHVSWLDILAVGSTASGVFVSRHDVKDWPGIGLFARLAGTVFIDRSSLRSAVESSRSIVTRAQNGIRVTFFPEGQATGGDEVIAFKPFLFGAIVEEGFAVQPLTLLYTHIGNAPVTHADRDTLYWYQPEQDFLAHIWNVLKLPAVHATAIFRTPLSPPAEADRSSLREFVKELRSRTGEGVPVWETKE